MRLIDILVIYLTVGAPIAALAFLRDLSRSKNAARSAFGFFWTLVLWPFFAVFEIWFMGKGQPRKGGTAVKLSPTQTAIQTMLNEINKIVTSQEVGLPLDAPVLVKAADLKESLDKYLELTAAVSSLRRGERAAEHEINFYRASGASTQSADISASCLHRRNMTRIRVHLQRSKHELIFSLLAYSGTLTSSGTITARRTGTSRILFVASRLLEVADRLGDRDLAVEVAAFLDGTFKDLARLEASGVNNQQQVEFVQPEPAASELLIGIQR